jgi:WD40 repeat protein
MPFMAFKHLKLSTNHNINYICKIKEKPNSFILCGEKKTFILSIEDKIVENEIKTDKNESIKNGSFPVELGESNYLFNSENVLYGIDLSKSDNYKANSLFSSDSKLLKITVLTKISFIISNAIGDLLFFNMEPIFNTCLLTTKIKGHSIFSHIKFNENTIIGFSKFQIFTINCDKGKIIKETIKYEKEIISMEINSNNKFLASGSVDGNLILYSINLNGELNVYSIYKTLHNKMIFQIIPLKNGNFCTCGNDEKLMILNITNEKKICKLSGIEHEISYAFELFDGRIFVFTFDNRGIVFNQNNGKIEIIFEDFFSVPKNVIESDNGALVLLKHNGDVDIMGVSDTFNEDNISMLDDNVIYYDIKQTI